MSFHQKGAICEGCNKRLLQVHPSMVEFFRWAKERHPELHIAVGWRGEEEQNKAVKEGRSQLAWPRSKHNHMEAGQPCSLALDLFKLLDDGQASFNPDFYDKLYQEILAADLKIRWGGNFQTLKDFDHFELILG